MMQNERCIDSHSGELTFVDDNGDVPPCAFIPVEHSLEGHALHNASCSFDCRVTCVASILQK